MKKDELRALPRASAANAKQALKNFTLSKLSGNQEQAAAAGVLQGDDAAKGGKSKSSKTARGANPKIQSQPRTYIAPGANVADEQKKSISRQLDDLQSTGPGMALLIAKDEVEQIIQADEIDLDDLLDRMEKAKTGTQFYTSGATIQDSMANQAKVDKFFSKYAQKGQADEESDDADE
jgi:hypothetical protein